MNPEMEIFLLNKQIAKPLRPKFLPVSLDIIFFGQFLGPYSWEFHKRA